MKPAPKNKTNQTTPAVIDAPLPLPALPVLAGEKVQLVATGLIDRSPTQARREFPEDKMAELREHIQTNGIQIPLLGRPSPKTKGRVELVAGERRHRCALALKLASVPVIVRDLTDAEVVRIQRAENAGRENLKALEQAEDYARLQAQGKTVPEIRAIYGGAPSHIYTRLRVARLAGDIKKKIRDGKLSITIADLVAKLPTPELQKTAAAKFSKLKWGDHPWSFRDAQADLEENYLRQLNGAPWKFDDAELVKSAGPCSTCPKRSGNLPGHEGNPNVCTDVKCFESKQATHTERVLAEATAAGQRIIPAKKYQGHRYEFDRANEKPWQDKKNRTLAQLATAAKIEPAVTVDDAGKIIQVFTREDKAKILAANKFGSSSFGSSSSSGRSDGAWRKKEAAQKKKVAGMAAALRSATPGILTKLAKGGIADGKLARLLAEAVYDMCGFPAHREKEMDNRQQWFAKATTTDCLHFIIEELLLSRVTTRDYNSSTWNPHALAAAKLAGVNLEKLRKTAPAKKPKTADPAKPADKKPTKKGGAK